MFGILPRVHVEWQHSVQMGWSWQVLQPPFVSCSGEAVEGREGTGRHGFVEGWHTSALEGFIGTLQLCATSWHSSVRRDLPETAAFGKWSFILRRTLGMDERFCFGWEGRPGSCQVSLPKIPKFFSDTLRFCSRMCDQLALILWTGLG